MSEHQPIVGLSQLNTRWIKRQFEKPRSLANEQLVSIHHTHWVRYVLPTLLYLLLLSCSVGLLYASFQTTFFSSGLPTAFFLAGLLLLTFCHHWFLWFLLAETQTYLVVTNKRFIYSSSGLLWGEEILEVSFEKVKTVEATKTTFFQSLFGYGLLQFEPMTKIHYVPHPGTIARQIEQAMGMI